MTRPARCCDAGPPPGRRVGRTQRGDALLGALVALLLASSLSLGLAYSASRTLAAHRFATTQGLAVQQLRADLATTPDVGALCAGGGGTLTIALPAGGSQAVPTTVACTLATANVTLTAAPTVTASTATPVPASLAVGTPAADAAGVALLGGDGRVAFSQ